MNDTDQVHIASLVVRTHPQALEAVAEAIAGWAEAEIAAQDPQGKLVVVLETSSEAQILDRIDAISPMPGVLSANLVYHQSESAKTLDEEIEP